MIRLDKYIADAAGLTRREAGKAIRSGAKYTDLEMEAPAAVGRRIREACRWAGEHGLHGLDRDLILPMVMEKQARVNACEYKGLCWRIDSVQSYFRFNMDILDPKMRKGLFRDELPVYTKVRDEMPAYYGDNSTEVNSLFIGVIGFICFRGR